VSLNGQQNAAFWRAKTRQGQLTQLRTESTLPGNRKLEIIAATQVVSKCHQGNPSFFDGGE
jgi:hypothetical protein